MDAELSALATSLEEMARRLDTLAHELDHEPTDRAAAELYETERALRTATRRLSSARRQLANVTS